MDKEKNTTGIRKRGRGGKYNLQPEPLPADEMRDIINSALKWYHMGQDNKPRTDEEVEQRISYYFTQCAEQGERPSVEKLALCLGVAKDTLNSWGNGETQSPRRSVAIKIAKDLIYTANAEMAANGKLNPLLLFHWGKCYHGMVEQQHIVIEPRQGITEATAAEVSSRYAALPED